MIWDSHILFSSSFPKIRIGDKNRAHICIQHITVDTRHPKKLSGSNQKFQNVEQ